LRSYPVALRAATPAKVRIMPNHLSGAICSLKISHTRFNRYVTFGAGITSLPRVRSTEGQFTYWLGVDDRLIADEVFRGSYTTGI
jgi:hypothetical protein